MDSLQRSLDATHQELSCLGLDVDSSVHTDDIRVMSNSADVVSRLGSYVTLFVVLQQNGSCFISKGCPLDTTLQIASDTIQSQLQI